MSSGRRARIGDAWDGAAGEKFGCFVEVLPGRTASATSPNSRTSASIGPEDVVKMGDMIWVKCVGVDDKGRVKLSRKAAMKERNEAASATPA